ncbi:MAG TPA: hypothetical protein VEB65_04640, partial [Solirubrobacterales bacterium]|nr:hypothetical protein [Solirubrobacterales bacterium]
ARWLRLRPAVLLLDEPTQGVDVGAIQLIYSAIRGGAAEGMAVVVCSSSADELVALCDRVLVIRRGRLEQQLEGAGLDRDALDAMTLIDTEGLKCA